MIDSIFWHVAAVAVVGLLVVIAVLLAKILRKPDPVLNLAGPKVDGEATLAAFNAILDRDEDYEAFDRPDQALVDTDNLKDFVPQVRQFSDNVLSVAAPLPEVYAEGVDTLLVRWEEKMVAWYSAVAEHQSDYAALLARAVEHDDNQSLVDWVVRSAIGFYSYDPLVKVREHIETGKLFGEATTVITERQEWLLSQRVAYFDELDRLRSVYAARWGWPVEDDETEPVAEPTAGIE